MRLKFFKRSEEKILSRIDPESEANQDLRVIFPGACPEFGSRGCPGVNTIYYFAFNKKPLFSNCLGLPRIYLSDV